MLGILLLAAVTLGGCTSGEQVADVTAQKVINDAPPTDSEKSTEVMLGSDELTSGIPGDGPLKLDEIKAWLADASNHRTLQVTLPMGLAAGQESMVGLAENSLTRAKIELGRQLYFDGRLSKDGTISCASCHHPDEGYTRQTQFGVGIDDQEGGRNSPASYNRILSAAQFWDGRAASLEEQAVGPIANPIEMGNTHENCVATLAEVPGYKLQFDTIFEDGLNIDNVGKAIAAFERTIVTGPSPFDYYEPVRSLREVIGEDIDDLEGLRADEPDLVADYEKALAASEKHPMSESAIRGREIFFGNRGQCTACHVGANLSDEKYHNLGVGMDKEKPDLGRFEVTKVAADTGAFKTPTIRNVALTAPYMHDGSQKTLAEVVAWYNEGGHPNEHLSKDVRKLNLSEQDMKDLVAFMEACTGEFTPVEQGRLPE
ncbi:MAG: cytochrome-c peroxidase [Planctomycetota bacterium]|nr:MAG: cytochrome-c peroxidase [Planctomycetota bacterium]REJ89427.1 MAG: cytochrome-c peroxidase [Planctomycetota bacterium]